MMKLRFVSLLLLFLSCGPLQVCIVKGAPNQPGASRMQVPVSFTSVLKQGAAPRPLALPIDRSYLSLTATKSPASRQLMQDRKSMSGGKSDYDLLVSGGEYIITGRQHGTSFDVEAWSSKEGAFIQGWEYLGQANQDWRVEDVGDNYFKIISVHSGLVMTYQTDDNNIHKIQQNKWADTDVQKWKFVPVDNGYYRIVSKYNGFCVTPLDTRNLLLQPVKEGDDTQCWSIERVDTDKLYSLPPSGLNPPTDNPYLTRYHIPGHWTDSLKWHNIIQAKTMVGLVDSKGVVDSAIVHNTIKKLSDDGGGVLFFAEGTYYLNFELKLEDGVIIRGANPREVIVAGLDGYSPPTRFEFPKYMPTFRSTGTSSRSAFKRIVVDTTRSVKNVGMVNIDINRATIAFLAGGYHTVEVPEGRTKHARYLHKNILIFGIRQNNAVIPSPEIPSAIQRAKGHAWQRWPWLYTANIDINTSSNCVIANCRLNDNITDNFEQPNYILDDGTSFSDRNSRFVYNDHSGICVNAAKISVTPKGRFTRHAFLAYNASVEPILNRQGIEIRNNYVKVNSTIISNRYVSIDVKGSGIKFRRNSVVTQIERVDNAVHTSGKDASEIHQTGLFFQPYKYISPSKDTLPYRLMKPKDYKKRKKYPLVLFFHGTDERGKDNNLPLKNFVRAFTRPENMENYPCFVLVPQHPYQQYFTGDRRGPAWPMVATMELLDSLTDVYSIDTDRVYVAGLSSGGYAAWEATIRYPDVFSALIAMGSCWEMQENLAQRLRHISMWFTRLETEPWPTMEIWKETIAYLIAAGAEPQFRIYKQAEGWSEFYGENQSWIAAENDPSLMPWLFAQKKKRNPAVSQALK